MRKPMVAGNWKMNGLCSSVRALIEGIKQEQQLSASVDMVVFPASVHLSLVRDLLAGTSLAWGAHCAGAMAMGRDKPLDSANSEFYFVLDAARDMDHEYTVIGRVVVGMDALKALKLGEPPASTDFMRTVRLLSELPATERPKVSVMAGKALSTLIEKVRRKKGADFSICDISVPAKID